MRSFPMFYAKRKINYFNISSFIYNSTRFTSTQKCSFEKFPLPLDLPEEEHIEVSCQLQGFYMHNIALNFLFTPHRYFVLDKTYF